MDFSSVSLPTPLEFQEICKCQGQCPDAKGVFVEISSCSINHPDYYLLQGQIHSGRDVVL